MYIDKTCPLIISDKWKGYLDLRKEGYIIAQVNHKKNFVEKEP